MNVVHKSNSRPTITFAIEQKEREFEAKLFLAYIFAQSGWRVYLGSTQTINELAESLDPSVIFHKSTHPLSKRFKDLGHSFVFLDEEGGITTPRSGIEEFCSWRYRGVNRENTDVVFLPNKKFENSVKSLSHIEGVELVTSGWPRIDLWRPEFATLHEASVESLRDKHGDFVLFVSSFGAGKKSEFRKTIRDSHTDMQKRVRVQRENAFQAHVELIKSLASDARYKVIVRPHPHERIEDWKKTLWGHPNIVISRKGDIAPWIRASIATIQTGSTTAVQSALLGVPTMAYKMRDQVGITDTLSFDVCQNVETIEELFEQIESGNSISPSSRDDLQKRLGIEAHFELKRLAADRIREALEIRRPPPAPPASLAFRSRTYLKILYTASSVKRIFQHLGLFRNGKTIVSQIPGGISTKEVGSGLSAFGSSLGGSKPFYISKIDKYACVIECP